MITVSTKITLLMLIIFRNTLKVVVLDLLEFQRLLWGSIPTKFQNFTKLILLEFIQHGR
jgi:hypothetical protein